MVGEATEAGEVQADQLAKAEKGRQSGKQTSRLNEAISVGVVELSK